MVLKVPAIPDLFARKGDEGEVAVWQGPRIIPSSFKSIEGFIFQNMAQTIFNADYEGWNAAINGTGVPDFENFIYDTFQNSTKITTNSGWTIASNKATKINYGYFVDIHADSISAIGDFEINDCKIHKEIDSNIWRLYCTTGSAAVKRAKVIKTLFYGSDGTNPRANSTYITNCTALKCSDSNDVGKRAYFEFIFYEFPGMGDTTITGTFAGGANTNVNSWSDLEEDGGVAKTASWQMPSGTTLNSVTGPNNSSDEIGTNTSGDDKNTPATCKINLERDANAGFLVDVMVLTKRAITWVTVDPGSGIVVQTERDFVADGFPAFTQAAATDVTATLLSTQTTFSRRVNGAFFIANFTEDTAGDIHFDVSADDKETWTLNVVPNTFFLFRKPGKKVNIRTRFTGSGNDTGEIFEYALVCSEFESEE